LQTTLSLRQILICHLPTKLIIKKVLKNCVLKEGTSLKMQGYKVEQL